MGYSQTKPEALVGSEQEHQGLCGPQRWVALDPGPPGSVTPG